MIILRVAFVVVTAAGAGCTGLSHRVDRGALAAVPNEELLVLFDAENAVFMARDDVALTGRNVDDAQGALRRARDYRDVIDARRTSGSTIDTLPVLSLLGEWNDARIAMREAELAMREEELDSTEVRLFAARARYEQEKARLVKDKNPEQGAGLELGDFDEQVKEWMTRENEALARIAEKQAVVTATRTTYFELTQRLQTASRGAYGGPWADLLD
jgi:hypothetical protein